jgi:hypothetical protein
MGVRGKRHLIKSNTKGAASVASGVSGGAGSRAAVVETRLHTMLSLQHSTLAGFQNTNPLLEFVTVTLTSLRRLDEDVHRGKVSLQLIMGARAFALMGL